MADLTVREYLELAKRRGVDISRRRSVENDCSVSFGLLGQYLKIADLLDRGGMDLESIIGITLEDAERRIDELSQYVICAESYLKTLSKNKVTQRN